MIPASLHKELASRIAGAVTSREAAVDVLKSLQAHYGWVTDEAVEEAASLLGLSPLQVEELATFYEMLYRRPVGKRVVHVCDSISCWAMGGQTLLGAVGKALGIGPGGTTEDGFFSLIPCCCLGNCGEAPAMMIGETQYCRVSPEQAVAILAEERQRYTG